MASRDRPWLGALLVAFVAGAVVSLAGVSLLSSPRAEAPKPDPAKLEPPKAQPAKPPPDRTKPTFGLDDADILLYLEAITQIKHRAIRLRSDVTRAQIVDQTLRAYLTRAEICCDYLPREEYRRLKASLNERDVGIGLEIRQDRDGRTICVPHPDGPAARAGIA